MPRLLWHLASANLFICCGSFVYGAIMICMYRTANTIDEKYVLTGCGFELSFYLFGKFASIFVEALIAIVVFATYFRWKNVARCAGRCFAVPWVAALGITVFLVVGALGSHRRSERGLFDPCFHSRADLETPVITLICVFATTAVYLAAWVKAQSYPNIVWKRASKMVWLYPLTFWASTGPYSWFLITGRNPLVGYLSLTATGVGNFWAYAVQSKYVTGTSYQPDLISETDLESFSGLVSYRVGFQNPMVSLRMADRSLIQGRYSIAAQPWVDLDPQPGTQP